VLFAPRKRPAAAKSITAVNYEGTGRYLEAPHCSDHLVNEIVTSLFGDTDRLGSLRSLSVETALLAQDIRQLHIMLLQPFDRTHQVLPDEVLETVSVRRYTWAEEEKLECSVDSNPVRDHGRHGLLKRGVLGDVLEARAKQRAHADMDFAERIQTLLLEVGVHLIETVRRKVLERKVDAQDLDLAVEDNNRILDLLCGLLTGAVCRDSRENEITGRRVLWLNL
jgi:hypothetical protein